MTVRENEPGGPDREPLDALLDPALEPLLAELDDALSAGRPTAEVEKVVAERFGTHATELVATLKALHEEGSRSRSTRHASAETWTMSTPVTAVSAPAGETLWQFGRFELLERIGSGGAGVVFKARDVQLRRLVALKVARAETLFSDEARQRFRREARVLAAVRHPNIIAIHEAGETGGLPYIVQELCHGPNLAMWLRDQQQARRPVPISVASRWVMLAAQAVAHAQQLGIVHRDLKPANILLEPQSAPSASNGDSRVDAFLPRITDFGIAKLFDSDEGVTATVAVLGTAAYMAPEQAEGKTREVGEPADVYSLGVILYELLTGRRPIEGQTDIDTLRRLSTDAPHSISEFRQDVPRDLQAICLKCLEKDPADRYPTAHELASDLESFLNGVPVTARPIGLVRRTFKAYRRQRPIIRIGLLASPILAATALFLIQHVANTPPKLEAPPPLARSYADQVHQAYELVEGTAGDTVDRQSVAETARRILARYIPHPGHVDSRGFEWHYLWEILHPQPPKLDLLREIPAHAASAYCVAFSPDGHFLATCSKDRTARVWDLATGECRATLTGHAQEINSIAYIGDGQTLATASEDGTVRLWDAKTAKQREILWKHPVEVVGLASDATRAHLAAGTHDGVLKVWDYRTRRSLFELRIHGGKRVDGLAYSPHGKLLATVGNGSVSLWDALHGYEHLADFPTKNPESLAFSHDGRLLAVGGPRISVFSVPQGELRALFPLPGHHVRSLLFTPDDLAVIACGNELSTAWIDLRTSVSTNPFGTPATNWCIAAAGDGRQMATADSTGIVRVWKGISSRPPCLTLDERQDVGLSMAASPDGKRIAVAGTGWLHEYFGKSVECWNGGRIEIQINQAEEEFGDVAVWDISGDALTRRFQFTARDNRNEVGSICYSGDGRTIAFAERARSEKFDTIRLVDSTTGVLRRSIAPRGRRQSLLQFCDSGKQLLVFQDAVGRPPVGAIEFHDVATGQVIKSLPLVAVPLAFSPQGEMLAFAGEHGCDICRLSDLRRVSSFDRSPIDSVVFTSHGDQIIRFDAARFWTISTATGQVLHKGNILVARGSIISTAIALSPDDRTAAIASREGVLLIDVESERQICSLPFPRPMMRVEQLIYTVDRRTIAAAAVDEIGRFGIYLWQAARAEARTDVAGE
jgi:WD40 repeat protein/tRNA A-37 threonylcarbamoyl transferase component Bud32